LCVGPITGEVVRGFRDRLGLTQEELAERLKYSRRTISRWENGETSPRDELRDRLNKLGK
jgi:transcriptional regulator with XRE-family HTH domain